MSRIDAARIAARKAEDAAEMKLPAPLTKGSVVASDAFFRLPMVCWLRSRPARLRLFNPAARFATTKSSRPPTNTILRWCSLASGISDTSYRSVSLAASASGGLNRPTGSPRPRASTASAPTLRSREWPSGCARLPRAWAEPILQPRRLPHDRCRPWLPSSGARHRRSNQAPDPRQVDRSSRTL